MQRINKKKAQEVISEDLPHSKPAFDHRVDATVRTKVLLNIYKTHIQHRGVSYAVEDTLQRNGSKQGMITTD